MNVSLRSLAAAVGVPVDEDTMITGIAHDSRRVREGELFVALPGTKKDGAEFVDEAVRRGAAAACVGLDARPKLDGRAIPLLRVENPRAALARLAASFYGSPAGELRMIGVSGTLGKTSTTLIVQAALAATAGGDGVGVVGSLGARVSGRARDRVAGALPDLEGMTTPDAPALHHALRTMADAGVRTVAMEVTSHALAQNRVDGITFALGVLTNLVPDEHLDFHGTAENYLATKARFLDLLAPDAPLVFNADDRLVRRMVAQSLARQPRPVIGVSLGEAARVMDKDPDDLAARDAAVSVEELRWDGGGASFVLALKRQLPGLEGSVVPEGGVPIVLPVLGVQQVTNAALAAAAALVAGASPDAVTHALAEMTPVRRRMEIVRHGSPLVIDDTAGHPDTLRAVFASIEPMSRSGLRVLFGVRGSRGVEINERLAATLAELLGERAQEESVRLVVTWSEDTALPRDRVTSEERDTVLRTLKTELGRLPHTAHLEAIPEARLEGAVKRVLEDVREDELILLLGAQGMDAAAGIVKKELRV
ncbi:MAG TPA: Mur ligase family protein [Gemmatimonadaceae bacterium]|nr:Mur ligase family protein [Gemmatimonadaceae bacterium]